MPAEIQAAAGWADRSPAATSARRAKAGAGGSPRGATAITPSSRRPGAAETDAPTLSSDARALRWHLYHLATRLRGAEGACPDARRWARQLLDGASDNPLTPVMPSREGAV